MDRNGGLSDLRLIKNTGLLVVERAGLFVSILNSTIAPGSFVLHIKSLSYRGSLGSSVGLESLGVEFLAFTWALSGLYLSRLVWAIFIAPGKILPSQSSGRYPVKSLTILKQLLGLC